MGDLAQLVAQIKDLQRSSPRAKQAWVEYSDTYLSGMRDPARQDEATLQGFLDSYGSEEYEEEEGAGENWGAQDDLVQQVKAVQRSCNEARQAWADYSDTYLAGMRDPARQDAEALQAFLDSWNSSEGSTMAAKAGPPEALVEKVKAIQRQGDSAREAWTEFCDTRLGGVRDPRRHDAATLKAFLSWYGVDAEVEVKTKARWPVKEARQPKPQPEKQSPVPADFVKLGANLSKQFKAAWVAYCKSSGQTVTHPDKCEEELISGFAEYAGQLLMADMGGEVAEAKRPATEQSGPPQKAARQGDAPAERKKLTIKKSLADAIRSMNAEGREIRIGAVAGPLGKLDEESAMAILTAVSEEEPADPNEFICTRVQEQLQAA